MSAVIPTTRRVITRAMGSKVRKVKQSSTITDKMLHRSNRMGDPIRREDAARWGKPYTQDKHGQWFPAGTTSKGRKEFYTDRRRWAKQLREEANIVRKGGKVDKTWLPTTKKKRKITMMTETPKNTKKASFKYTK